MTDDLMAAGGYQEPAATVAQPKAKQTTVADYEPLIQSAAKASGIDPDLLRAHMQVESSGNPQAVSPQGAVGLMQLMPATAKALGVKDATDPKQAIPAAARLIRQNLDASNGDVATAIRMYHGGPDQKQWGPKTDTYTQKVMATMGAYAPGDLMMQGGYTPANVAPTGLRSDQPVTAAATPAALARPYRLEDSSAFRGYDGRDQPVFDSQTKGYASGAPVNRDLPSIDPSLPPAPKGYYWPEGAEVGADGKVHMDMAGDDPNRIERFDPQAVADELARERLSMTPSGQAALQAAQAREAKMAASAPNGVEASAANGAFQGFLPQADAAVIGARTAGQNLLTGLTGGRAPYSAGDMSTAVALTDRGQLASERAANPFWAPVATTAGSAYTALPLIETGVGALRAVPTAARALGAGEGLTNALTTGSRFVTGDLGQGSGIGNLLLRTGSKTAAGATQGAMGGAATTGLTDRPIGENMITGALTGGALGGGGSLAFDTTKGILGAGRSALQPLTEQGREEIVGDVLRRFAANGPTDLNTAEYIPGVRPTLAQATGNRGLASLETAFQSGDPGVENAFSARARANGAARDAYVDAIRGNKSHIEALQAARDADAGETLRTAFANAKAADSTSSVAAIDKELAGPEGQVAESRAALTAARKRLVGSTEGLTPEQDQGFQRAMLESMGAPETRLDNVTMANAKERIGVGLDAAAENTHVKLTDDVMNHFGGIAKDWIDAGYEEKPIQALIAKIGDVRGEDGTISGDAYQTLTRKGGPFDKLANLGAGYQKASGELREVLDQALEDSSSPADIANVRQLRGQYRNMKMIEQAMMGSPLGDTVTPKGLLSSIKANTSNFVYKGGNDLGDAAAAAYKQAQPREQLETDPAKLFGIRDDLDKVARAGGPGAASAAKVRDQIDSTIQTAAPGYSDYLGRDAGYAQQIAEKRFLQQQRLDKGAGNITAAKVRSLAHNIDTAGLKSGEQPASSVSPATVDKFNALLSDLNREQSALPNGKLGSNTVNKLASQGILAKMGIPMLAAELFGHHVNLPGAGEIMATVAGTGAKALYNSKDALVHAQLQNALLNPEIGGAMLRAPTGVNLNQIPLVASAGRQVPTIGEVLNNLLLRQPAAANGTR